MSAVGDSPRPLEDNKMSPEPPREKIASGRDDRRIVSRVNSRIVSRWQGSQ